MTRYLIGCICSAVIGSLVTAGLLGITTSQNEQAKLSVSPVALAQQDLQQGLQPTESFTLEERINIAVYQRCNRAVVHISNHAVSVDRFFMVSVPEEGSGSGALIDRQGHILTNYHVIKGAQRLVVTLFNGDQYEAELVGHDAPNDMAVLKIDAPENVLFPIQMGRSDALRVGQKIYAIGNPFGLERTMTVGIISSLNRTLPTSNHRMMKSIIQVDAALNRGNSGGPLLDRNGRLVGMNTAIASRTGENTGIGFAIPVSTVSRVVPELIANGRVVRPTIGIESVTENSGGLRIVQLTPGGAAERAGLRGVRVLRRRTLFGEERRVDMSYADVINSIDGEPVRSIDDLLSQIERRKAGDKVTLDVTRDNQTISVVVTLDSDY